MTYEEKVMKLDVGKVVKHNRAFYDTIYGHVVGFEYMVGWELNVGVIVKFFNNTKVLSLEEIEL